MLEVTIWEVASQTTAGRISNVLSDRQSVG